MTKSAPKNPYTTVAVKAASMFFGREREFVEIKERIQHPQPISTILIGGRKIGKTSLLYQIRNQLLAQPDYEGVTVIPAFVDLEEVIPDNIPAVFEGIISAINDSLLEHWDISINLPIDVAVNPYKAFCQQLEAIWYYCSEHIGSVRFAVLIDEADKLLGHPWTKDVFSNFRHLINSSKLNLFVALIITGFRSLHEYAPVEDGIGSPFGNAARWTRLSVLTKNECRDLTTMPLNGKVNEAVIEAVYEQSGGHPFVTQYLMEKVWKPNPVGIILADVAKASKQFKKEVRVFPSWKEKFTKFDRQVYRVLAQAKKMLTLSEIRKLSTDKPEPGDIQDSVEFLRYTGVIAEQDEKYVAVGNLFRDWFLQRNPERDNHMSNLKQEQGFSIKHLVISALVIMAVFVIPILVLVWAAKQVSDGLLVVFIILIAMVFFLVIIVTVLVMIGILRPKWAMDFYNTVFNRVASMLESVVKRLGELARQVTGQEKDS